MTTEPYMALRTSVTAKTNSYTVKLDRGVSEASEWQEELDTMRLAKEGDDVTLYINTWGGNADTMKEMLHIMENSEATFHGVLAGACYSAGGPIFLACDTVEVGRLAGMMCHTVQTGYSGSGNAVAKYGNYINEDARNILTSCYTGFLTQEEVEGLLSGDDLWLNATQIGERLELRAAFIEENEKEVTREAVTLNEYTQQAFGDLRSDCDYMAFKLEDVLSKLQEIHEEVLTEDPTPEGKGYMIDGAHIDVEHCNRDLLLDVAKFLKVPFSHNISTDKLRQRVLDKLNKETK